MPTHRGKPSKSHPGLDYETRKGSKYYHRNHHEVKPYQQKRKHHGGNLPMILGGIAVANALKGLIFGKGTKKKGGARKGYSIKGPIGKKGFY